MTTEIRAWLDALVRAERPPSAIVGYNIGIYETERGFCAYLTGARHFTPDNDDWACTEDFAARERFLVLDRQPLPWPLVLDMFVSALRSFMADAAGRTSFLGRATAVTVGFAGGDLVRVA